MRPMTEGNLKAAFAGESQAHMRYLAFADAAEQEGKANTARLFRAIAYAEQVHATNHLRELGGISNSPANLQEAMNGETFEVEEMYPAYVVVAQAQGEKTAEKFFNWAMAAEKVHADAYRGARSAVESGRDIAYKPIHVCSFCGFTMEGDAPDKCPLCGTPKGEFLTF